MPAWAAEPAGHAAGRVEQRRSTAARHRQGVDRSGRAVGGAEALGEAADALDLGAPEGVDRLVGIADDDEVATAAGDQAEQLLLGRVGVLVLVDHDERPGVPLAGQQRGLVTQQVDGGPDQLGRVVRGRMAQARDADVLRGEPGNRHPVVAAPPATERGQLDRTDTPLDRPHEHVAQLLGEAPGAQRGLQPLGPVVGTELVEVAAKEVADQQVLLGAGQQPGRRLAAHHGLTPQQPERVGMERPGQRLADRARQPRGDPVAEFRRGPAAEREDQDLLRVDAVALDPVDDRLHQRRGLPGARPGEHEQRPAAVFDHLALRGVEHGSGHRGPRHAHESYSRLPHQAPTPRTSRRRHPTTARRQRRRHAPVHPRTRSPTLLARPRCRRLAKQLRCQAARRPGGCRPGCRPRSSGNPRLRAPGAPVPRSRVVAARTPSPPATTVRRLRTTT